MTAIEVLAQDLIDLGCPHLTIAIGDGSLDMRDWEFQELLIIVRRRAPWLSLAARPVR